MRRGNRVARLCLFASLLCVSTLVVRAPAALAQGEGIIDSPHDFAVYS